MQFSSLSSSKMEISETDFFDTLTIQNDQISHVKRVLAPLYAFFTLFGCWGWGGSQGSRHNLLMQFSRLSSSRMVVPLSSSRCLAEGNIFALSGKGGGLSSPRMVGGEGWGLSSPRMVGGEGGLGKWAPKSQSQFCLFLRDADGREKVFFEDCCYPHLCMFQMIRASRGSF